MEGLGINFNTERAITQWLGLAKEKLCLGYTAGVVVSSLEYVITYVANQSGGAIPAADADYIIGQLLDMIGALDAGTGVCCSNPAPSYRPGAAAPAGETNLEVFPNPFREQATVRFFLHTTGQNGFGHRAHRVQHRDTQSFPLIIKPLCGSVSSLPARPRLAAGRSAYSVSKK
ncbi:MAG: hypothetical protein J5I98_13390, partial [Phaeodactylibacter sp.]|nr:hypothetical protein [Phaeodactylibacter sp.]